MRRELQPLCGKRGWFTGTFERYGSFYDKDEQRMRETVVLQDVMDEDGALLTAHAWISNNSEMRKHVFLAGDKVRFYGKVREYRTGRKTDYGFCDIKEVGVMREAKTEIGPGEYQHGDIVLVADPKIPGAKPYPCVVVREAYSRDEGHQLVVLRTNNPDFIKNYEEDVSTVFVILGRRKAFILSSQLYISPEDVIEKAGSLTPSQIREFDAMLRRNSGLLGDVDDEDDYRIRYESLRKALRSLAE